MDLDVQEDDVPKSVLELGKSYFLRDHDIEKVDLIKLLKEIMTLDEIKKSIETLRSYVIDSVKIRGFKLEVCPTSNVFITSIGSLVNHPYLKFKKYGIEALIGSDDPAVLNTNVHIEAALLEALERCFQQLF